MTDDMTPRERLVARYRDPTRPPFPRAVPNYCTPCGSFIIWTTPPDPGVPFVCAQCAIDALS